MAGLIEIGLSNLAMAGLLAVVAATVGRCYRRPALTHGLWLLVLLKLITPPLVPVPMGWLAPTRTAPAVIAESPVQIEPDQPGLAAKEIATAPEALEPREDGRPAPAEFGFDKLNAEPAALPAEPEPVAALDLTNAELASAGNPFPWALTAGTIWLAGSTLWLLLAARRVRQFQRLLASSGPAPPGLEREVRALAERLGLRAPQVCLVPGVLSPMIWVLGRCRRLLLPEHLLFRLSPEQRTSLLAHELAHLKRGDPWVRYLELAVLASYWWCPLVWWARAELREAEEECCDAWVVWALPGSARAYALALVETVDFMADVRPALPALASGFGHVQALRRRLTMIMRGSTPRALTAWGTLALVTLGLLSLPLLPTWAQQPRQPDESTQQAEDEAQRDDLKKLHKKIEQMRRDLDEARVQLQAKRTEIEDMTRDLQDRIRRLQTEQRKHPSPLRTPVPRKEPLRKSPWPTPDSGVERRLAEVERKLLEALRDLQGLRRQLGAAQRTPTIPPRGYQIPAPQPGAVPNPPPPLGYVMPLKSP